MSLTFRFSEVVTRSARTKPLQRLALQRGKTAEAVRITYGSQPSLKRGVNEKETAVRTGKIHSIEKDV
jgi:hypothetical protein